MTPLKAVYQVQENVAACCIGMQKYNLIHAQLRMNCGDLNVHLSNFHANNNPACLCSHSIEDTANFFLLCRLIISAKYMTQ